MSFAFKSKVLFPILGFGAGDGTILHSPLIGEKQTHSLLIPDFDVALLAAVKLPQVVRDICDPKSGKAEPAGSRRAGAMSDGSCRQSEP